MNETALTIIGILLLTGAMAKSAQIPLHSWLPGSMEGFNGVKHYFLKLIISKTNIHRVIYFSANI
jgi:formate hydrogenlyase subunit 3/multisubunit Na+/H+ antiporter MnhD subunit